ncbi:hypothetical protein BDR26DRAFT_898783 [Obelidium mucronatum]|nr:hypothetical protein BDR26DRAFT_898783 [Obelidium mucronatum]
MIQIDSDSSKQSASNNTQTREKHEKTASRKKEKKMREIYKHGKHFCRSNTATKAAKRAPPPSAHAHTRHPHTHAGRPAAARTPPPPRLRHRRAIDAAPVPPAPAPPHVFARLEEEALRILKVCSAVLYPDIDSYCAIGDRATHMYSTDTNYTNNARHQPDIPDQMVSDTSAALLLTDEMSSSELYSATVDTVAEQMLTDLSSSTMLMMMTMLNRGPGVGVLAGSELLSSLCSRQRIIFEARLIDVPVVHLTDVDVESTDEDTEDYEVIHNSGFDLEEERDVESVDQEEDGWEHL